MGAPIRRERLTGNPMKKSPLDQAKELAKNLSHEDLVRLFEALVELPDSPIKPVPAVLYSSLRVSAARICSELRPDLYSTSISDLKSGLDLIHCT
jgi:hypothetical protein